MENLFKPILEFMLRVFKVQEIKLLHQYLLSYRSSCKNGRMKKSSQSKIFPPKSTSDGGKEKTKTWLTLE
jgi:hypothetical protein